jgi:predicted dehydrogenase
MTSVGLIGAGRWGKVYIKTLVNIPEFDLKSIASGNNETKKIVNGEIKVYEDVNKMLDAEFFDGIIVAIPAKFHIDILKLLIPHRIPILIEKPLALSVRDCNSILDLSIKYNTPIIVDHIHVYSQAFISLCKNLHHIGDIKKIETYASNFGPYRDNIDVLWDWGSHDISMILKLLDIKSDKLIINNISKNNYQIENAQTLKINLMNLNIDININISNNKEKTRKFIVTGVEGCLEYDDLREDKIIFHHHYDDHIECNINNILNKNLPYKKPLNSALEYFSKCIKNGGDNSESLIMGIEVSKVLESLSIYKIN